MSSHSFTNQVVPSPGELDEVSRSAYERRIQRLEDERKELVRKLTDTNIALQKMAHGSPSPGSPTKNNEAAADSNKASSEKSGAEVRKLQDEVSFSFRFDHCGNAPDSVSNQYCIVSVKTVLSF